MKNQQCRHREVMFQMLCELDAVCRRNNIRYMLFAGTALGAVRHGGFIPWDDDLDIVMLRKDYERFLSVAEKELDPGRYFVQKEFSEHWPMFFSKLRRNNTAFIERQIPKDRLMHQGVYIDIFPCDNLSESRTVALAQFVSSKVVIAKSLFKRGYITSNPIKKLFIQLCRLLPQDPFWKFVVRLSDENSKMVHTFFGGASKFKRNVYPRAWLTEAVELPFESGHFPVSAHYDELLTTMYGDYMTPLPESARGKKVHAELVDLDNSYEKYWGIQRDMSFCELTRSIR